MGVLTTPRVRRRAILSVVIAFLAVGSAPIHIAGQLVGPGNERIRFSWYQPVDARWLYVGYSYPLPTWRLRDNPGLWTLELTLDGQRAGQYTLRAGNAAMLASLRGKPAPPTIVARTEPAVKPPE